MTVHASTQPSQSAASEYIRSLTCTLADVDHELDALGADVRAPGAFEVLPIERVDEVLDALSLGVNITAQPPAVLSFGPPALTVPSSAEPREVTTLEVMPVGSALAEVMRAVDDAPTPIETTVAAQVAPLVADFVAPAAPSVPPPEAAALATPEPPSPEPLSLEPAAPEPLSLEPAAPGHPLPELPLLEGSAEAEAAATLGLQEQASASDTTLDGVTLEALAPRAPTPAPPPVVIAAEPEVELPKLPSLMPLPDVDALDTEAAFDLSLAPTMAPESMHEELAPAPAAVRAITPTPEPEQAAFDDEGFGLLDSGLIDESAVEVEPARSDEAPVEASSDEGLLVDDDEVLVEHESSPAEPAPETADALFDLEPELELGVAPVATPAPRAAARAPMPDLEGRSIMPPPRPSKPVRKDSVDGLELDLSELFFADAKATSTKGPPPPAAKPPPPPRPTSPPLRSAPPPVPVPVRAQALEVEDIELLEDVGEEAEGEVAAVPVGQGPRR